jgi:hypothetical protein
MEDKIKVVYDRPEKWDSDKKDRSEILIEPLKK